MSLFKYRAYSKACQIERVKDTIRRGAFWFSVAQRVNDPFEFRCSVNFDKNVEAAIEAFVALEISRGTARQVADAKVRQQFRNIPVHKLRERAWELSDNIWRGLGPNVLLSCFSETADIPLMWSHYADGHRGVAIEFIPPKGALIKQVEYLKENLCIDPRDFMTPAASAVMQRLLHVKSKHWEYEREVRMVLPGTQSVEVQFGPSSVCRVVIGLAMEETTRRELVEWLERYRPDVKVAFALPADSTSYGLAVVDSAEFV